MSLWSRIWPPYTGSSADTVFGVPFYGHPSYHKRWFRWTFGLFHSFLSKIDDVWYFWHYRFVDRMHVVKTGLAPGYYDVDEIMFRACFALLGRFVEQELGIAADDEANYRGYRIHAADGRDQPAIDLWLQYKHDLPQIIEDYHQDVHEVYKDAHSLEKQDDGTSRLIITTTREPKFSIDHVDKLKDKMLRELMEIRRNLWT